MEVTNAYTGDKKEPKSQARVATPNVKRVSELVTNAARPRATRPVDKPAKTGKILL